MAIWKRLRDGWMAFAHVLGRAQTAILLTLIYLLTVGPISLLSRLTGQDLLRLRRSGKDSYWAPLERTTKTLDEARKQF